jgi:hypothetical protein
MTDYLGSYDLLVIAGPHLQTDLWNLGAEAASEDIVMLGADDLIFRTPAWDARIAEAFAPYPDGIVMVYADDGSPTRRPTHPFLTRSWIEAVGFFTPPFFASWMADRWIWELAKAVGRSVYVDVLIEHMHPIWGKADTDPLYEAQAQARKQQDVRRLYRSDQMVALRREQAERLRQVIRAA